MKLKMTTVFAAILIVLTPAMSMAVLIDINDTSGHVIYDNVSKQYWIWDLNAFSNRNYQQQLNLIGQYNSNSYFDINTWHMASLSEMRSLWLGNTYTSPAMFNKTYDTSTWDAWYGRYDSQSDSTHHYVAVAETQPQYNIYFNWALEIIPVHDNSIWADFDHINNSVIGAWVTSTAAVPEPSSIFLVLCGMPVVMIMLRRQGKKE